MTLPHATYTGPKSSHDFVVDPSEARYNTTVGETSGASDYVLKQGHQDIDQPSGPKKAKDGQYTRLSELRMQLTGLQDDINQYLTEKICHVKKPRNARQEREINELLDGSEDI